MTAGTALVGACRRAGMLFRKGGTRIEPSNSHADFFIRNLTAVPGVGGAAFPVGRHFRSPFQADVGEFRGLLAGCGGWI